MSIIFGRTSRKPAIKQDSIVRELRRQIVDGHLPPGARLPIRKELEVQFSASLHTVQRALDRLASDGFVCARGSQGTFVVDVPPHLSRYALVFALSPTSHLYPRLWTAMANEATKLERNLKRRFVVYYGIDGHSDTEDYQRLLGDVRSQRVAGLIFPSMPHLLVGTPLLTEPGMPRASVGGLGLVPGIAQVTLDRKDFLSKALDYFVAKGCKRVAFISPAAKELTEDFKAAVAPRPLETRPYWVQSVGHACPEAAKEVAHLLMHKGQKELPDALLIGDDNQVEHATAGLLDAGVNVPEELTVVAHCNFPWPTPAAIPVRRLGYDARHVLQACIDQVDFQRRERRMPESVAVDAVFDDEIK